MRLRSALSIQVGAVLAFLAMDGCASAPQGQASAATPNASASLNACLRNVQTAVTDSWFMCSLASASLAHEEAGREARGNADCLSAPETCEAPDSSLVIRVLFSPPAFGSGPPRASSIELAGFDKPLAHVNMRELVGPEDWYTRKQMTAGFARPPMKQGAGSGFDLSKEATAGILKLAHDLRKSPEQHSWTMCTQREPGEKSDTVIMMGDAAGIFIQLFFGGEEHAYLRNSMYLGHAGELAALVFGDPPNTDECIADTRL